MKYFNGFNNICTMKTDNNYSKRYVMQQPLSDFSSKFSIYFFLGGSSDLPLLRPNLW